LLARTERLFELRAQALDVGARDAGRARAERMLDGFERIVHARRTRGFGARLCVDRAILFTTQLER
jgi:hypothetical protein